MTSSSSSLRRNVDFDASRDIISRGLQSNVNKTLEQQPSDSHDNNNPYKNRVLISVLTVVAIFVVTCYMVCLWHKLLKWLCKRIVEDETTDNTTSDMNRRVFDLTPGQRRAVLEAIFSDTSKAVTKADVFCRKEKRKTRSNSRKHRLVGDIPTEVVAVPTSKSTNTSDDGSDHDVEVGVVMTQEPDVPALPADYFHTTTDCEWRQSVPASIIGEDAIVSRVIHSAHDQFVIETAESMLPESLAQASFGSIRRDMNDDAVSEGTVAQLPQVATGDPAQEHFMIPIRIQLGDGSDDELLSPTVPQFPDDLAVPDLRKDLNIRSHVADAFAKEVGVEESIEEEKSDDVDDERIMRSPSALLSQPIALTPVDSLGSTFTSDFDDETEDNVCPVCIHSYHEGDILIASKHCSHTFHRDCILEWLEKHDSCPVCRIDMVTEGEINQAATSIVGQTRMFVAVGSIARSTRLHQGQNATAHRHVLPAHRSITVSQQTPPSSPHRYARGEHFSR